MKPKVILIKKYENRRLYDTVNSRYVNLEEVAKMMQKGDVVRVVDAISGEDITRLVLTQIIVEDAKEANSTFPIDLLRQMVVASGRATQDGAIQYLQTLLNVYEKSYRALAPTFPFGRQAEGAQEYAESRTEAHAQPATRGSAPAASVDGNLAELKARVAELEALVSSLSPKAKVKRAAKKQGSSASRRG